MQTRKDFLTATGTGATLAMVDPRALENAAEQPFRHRQVFAARGADAQALLNEMTNSLDVYEHDLGEGPGTLHVAAVLYGSAVIVGLDNAAWSRYRLAARIARADATNPFAAQVAELEARHASFFVCNKALIGIALSIFNATPNQTHTADDVLGDLQAHVLPNVVIVPAGVAALNALQEAKFTFVQASL